MKKLVLSVALVAFGLAVQAGDCCKATTQTAAKPACSAKTKVATCTKVSSDKAQCAVAKEGRSECCALAKTATCKDGLAKQNLQSPKGFEQAKR